MFDNPKKELERLEQQLLAADADEDEFLTGSFDEDDDLFDEDDSDGASEDPRTFSRRSVGFAEQNAFYTMDTDRYVAAPKKRSFGKFLRFCLIVGLLLLLFAWWKGWLL